VAQVVEADVWEPGPLQQRIAVLPVGSFERHGDFLPLITDTIVAGVIAGRLSADYGLLLLPPVTLSCSHEHSGFAGTVSISAETLIAVVTDVAESLYRSGIERLAIVNGHGGNHVLANIVQQANVAGPRMTLFPGRTEWEAARAAAGLQAAASEDMHAGELEASLLLHTYPELVGENFRQGDWQASPGRICSSPACVATASRESSADRPSQRPRRAAQSSTAWRDPSRIISRCCHDSLHFLQGPAGRTTVSNLGNELGQRRQTLENDLASGQQR
jgi:creatinine amidohydrolase